MDGFRHLGVVVVLQRPPTSKLIKYPVLTMFSRALELCTYAEAESLSTIANPIGMLRDSANSVATFFAF